MKKIIHNDKCYHCGQILTPEARKHLEKIGGLLAKTSEQLKAEEEAEAKRIEDLANQKYEAKVKA